MPIIYNKTNCTELIFNGTKLDKVIIDGTTVFESNLDVFYNGRYGGGVTALNAYYVYPNVSGIHRPAKLPTITRSTIITGSWVYCKGSILTNIALNVSRYKYITVYGSASSSYGTYGCGLFTTQTGSSITSGSETYTNIDTKCITFPLNTKTAIPANAGNRFIGLYLAQGSNGTGTGIISRILLSNS